MQMSYLLVSIQDGEKFHYFLEEEGAKWKRISWTRYCGYDDGEIYWAETHLYQDIYQYVLPGRTELLIPAWLRQFRLSSAQVWYSDKDRYKRYVEITIDEKRGVFVIE